MRDRVANIAPIAALAGVLGLCCGLPVLLSLGILGAAASLSLQSSALIGVGLVLAVGGLVRLVKHQSSRDPDCDIGGPPASQAFEYTTRGLVDSHRGRDGTVDAVLVEGEPEHGVRCFAGVALPPLPAA